MYRNSYLQTSLDSAKGWPFLCHKQEAIMEAEFRKLSLEIHLHSYNPGSSHTPTAFNTQ